MTSAPRADGAHDDPFYEALRDDDAELLYQRAPCGYLSTTPDGLLIKVNQTFLDLTGYGHDDLVGRRRFADLLTGGGRIYHETHFAPLLLVTGTARSIALDLVRADGERLPVLVNAVVDHDESGAPAVVRTAVFDATERRNYERELQRAKERAEASEAAALELVRTLQQVLIPPKLPDVHGLDLAAAFRSAGAGDVVGGDFYDVFQIGPQDWIVVIGDVCGKGPHAAVVSALARYVVRGAVMVDPSPASALALLNRALLDHPTDRYCTALVMRLRYDEQRWFVTVSAGGHPLPLMRSADGTLTPMGEPGDLIGVFAAVTHADVTIEMSDSDAFVAYTDGVTEARDGDDFFGEERLERIVSVAHRSAADLADEILRRVLEFRSGHSRDDVAVVAVRVTDEA